jgi:hypothetical protein
VTHDERKVEEGEEYNRHVVKKTIAFCTDDVIQKCICILLSQGLLYRHMYDVISRNGHVWGLTSI